MKINVMWKLESEVRAVLDFHISGRWAEFKSRLTKRKYNVQDSDKMYTLIERKYILKILRDLKLLIQRIEKDIKT